MPCSNKPYTFPPAGLPSEAVMVYRRPATWLLIGAALLTCGQFVPETVARAVIVLIPALLLPGASLLLGLGLLRGRWDPVPTLALCAITSFAFYPLAGLLINAAGIRLSTLSVSVEVDIFLMLMLGLRSAIGVRQNRRSAPLLPALQSDNQGGLLWAGWLAGVAVACAIVLVAGLLLLPKQTPSPFTEFYFTGVTARLSGTITTSGGGHFVAPVAVRNQSTKTEDYVIKAVLDGAIFAPDRLISIPKSRTWTGSIGGFLDQPGCLHQLVITLLNRSNQSEVSSLDLWLRTSAPGCPK